jgi:hypothetical protein
MRATIDGPATGKHSGIGWVGRGRPAPPPAMRVAILPYRRAIPMNAGGLPCALGHASQHSTAAGRWRRVLAAFTTTSWRADHHAFARAHRCAHTRIPSHHPQT